MTPKEWEERRQNFGLPILDEEEIKKRRSKNLTEKESSENLEKIEKLIETQIKFIKKIKSQF